MCAGKGIVVAVAVAVAVVAAVVVVVVAATGFCLRIGCVALRVS